MGILKIPRITTTNRTGLTLGLGELVYDTDLDEIYKGDGATSGGIAISSGTGDVVGPASAVNNRVVLFDGTTGKLIKDSGLTLSGTNTGDQTISLTGDVTGSGTGSFAATISNNSVTLGKMANVATGTVFYRTTAGTGSPEVQTLATLKTDLGLSGTNSGDQTITLTGDVTGSGTGSFATSIGANKVTNAMLAQAAANSILGNKTGSAANVAYLTSTEVTAMLDTFTSTLKGLTPASGGGTTKFLRADGTWAAPYTFSTGLTESAGTVTANLSTGVAGGQTVIGGTAASNNLTLWSTSNATKGKILFGTSSYDEANNRLGIGTASPSYGVHFVLPTLNTGETAFYLSSAISAASTGIRTMIQWDLTTAGSNTSNIYGFNVNLLAGYTGASATQCARFINSASGTGTNIFSGSVNAAAAATANGVTNGTNFGLGGTATNGLVNIGNRSVGTGGSTAASTNIGICGFGNNGTSTGTCFQIGGFFGLHTATPTFGASAALMCDNDTQAVDIFVARDNGTAVFKVTDNGNTIVGGLAAISTSATDGYLYLPTCAGIPTGTPTSYTGKAAMVIDTTNNKAYVYSGGAWRILN